jgi:hypothetical protein
MYLYKPFFRMFVNLLLIKTQIFDKSINTLFSKVKGNVTIVKHGINTLQIHTTLKTIVIV